MLLPTMLLADAADFLGRLPKRAWSGSLTEVAGGFRVPSAVISQMSCMRMRVAAGFRLRHRIDVLVGSGAVTGDVVQCSSEWVSVLFLFLFLGLTLFRVFGGHT